MVTGYDTARHPTIWPTRQQAETVMRPGDTLRVIGQTWIVLPPGFDAAEGLKGVPS